MTTTRLAIIGCTGRMGRALLRLASEDSGLALVAAVTAADDPLIGQDAGVIAGAAGNGVRVAPELSTSADVAIEFTAPAGCVQWARRCAELRLPLVSGTTGLTQQDRDTLADAARSIPLLWAANMSIGVNLLLRLLQQAAAALPGWDVEIVEAHHRRKVDAPSGTARAMLDAVCQARGVDPLDVATYGRFGQCGPRTDGEIGVHAVRMGSVVGLHEVDFASPHETLTLRHDASSRDAFAAGALRAAKWLAGRPAGLYDVAAAISA